MTDPTQSSGRMSGEPVDPAAADQTDGIMQLMEELADPDIIPRRHAREALVKTGEPALPLMLEGLAHGNFLVRWEVAKGLMEMKSPRSVPALIRALEDEEQDVRWLAAVALAQIGRESLEPLLEAVLNNLSSLFLRQGVHHVLTIYRDPELRDSLLQLWEALGPLENDAGLVPSIEGMLRALRK